MNIVDPILHHFRVNAEQAAICAPASQFGLVTYAQLEYMMNNLTRALSPHGFQPGQIVGIRLQDPILHVALTLALTRIGVVTVTCGDSIPPEIGATAVITDSAEPVAGARRNIRANPDWVTGSGEAVFDALPAQTSGKEICRIFLTSGSTGAPKGVAVSHDALIGRNFQFAYAFGGRWPNHSRVFCNLGLGAEPTFRFIIYMLMRGGMIMFHGGNEMATEQSLDLYRIQSMVTAPLGLAEHLKVYEQTEIRCCLDHVLTMGGNVSSDLLQRVWARMCPNVFSDYGATEIGSVASADLRDTHDIPGCAGFIVPPNRAEIVTENDTPTAPDTEGIVRLQTPWMANGYVGLPDATARFFRDGWFYPGDYGYLTRDNVLVITGRVDTRLNIGGSKIDPERIEEVLKAFAGVDDAAVLTVPNALGLEEVYALVQARGAFDREALRSHCQSKLGRSFIPVRFIGVDRVPRGETGKIQRDQLREIAKSRFNTES